MTLPNGQKVVALDFDGVLHRYHGWNEGKLDVPISGMTHLVDLLMVKHGCHVVVHTTRAKDVVQTWLAKYGFPELDVYNEKWSRIDIFVDDRAMEFHPALVGDRESRFALAEQLATFQPYWKQQEGKE